MKKDARSKKAKEKGLLYSIWESINVTNDIKFFEVVSIGYTFIKSTLFFKFFVFVIFILKIFTAVSSIISKNSFRSLCGIAFTRFLILLKHTIQASCNWSCK